MDYSKVLSEKWKKLSAADKLPYEVSCPVQLQRSMWSKPLMITAHEQLQVTSGQDHSFRCQLCPYLLHGSAYLDPPPAYPDCCCRQCVMCRRRLMLTNSASKQRPR